jgi:ring-1,2-phenylacetyl-CoA epoxidase subunit PaaE
MTNTIQLTIKDKIQETADTVTFVFNETFDDLPYKAGQFLTVLVTINEEVYKREYSFSSSPQINRNLSITVKRVKTGKVSNFICDHFEIGMTIAVLPAAGTFIPHLNASNKRTIVLIAGGSGITPLFAMAKSILAIELWSKVYLIYANRTEHDIIFKKELEQLQLTYAGRFNHLNVISQASDKWYGLSGRLHQDSIIACLEQLPVIFPKEAVYFICAPSGLINEVQLALSTLKVPASKIHKENFGFAPTEIQSNKDPEIKDQTVTVKYKSTEHRIFVPAGKSILKAASDEHIRLPFSCEKGVCTACIGTCITGKVAMKGSDALSENEIAKGYVLTCIGKPLTADVYIDLD